MSELVLCDVKDGVATLTLHRPEQLNALTVAMGDAFSSKLDEIAENDEVRAIVLTGAGRAFSAGGDLDFLQARQQDTPAGNSAEMKRFYRRFLRMRALGIPLIAAINGHAIGAGMCLALACDVRLATPKAKLGLTFVGLGLHPGMGATYLLPALVGPQVSARLLLTGETLRAEEMCAMGVVAETHENALERAHELAAKMAAQAPLAVQQTLLTLREKQDEGLDRALSREAQCQAANYASADLAEGIAALKEKRKPEFKGL
ncbi:MAG: enoyl-CoA hydratase/isomerase family protein [Deltaproteobacteria bacterium]|nr:enoyl-CoA hydratase/isomerase family protein [Deltaproteobacteria bacterium]